MANYFKKDLPESPIYVFGHPMRFDLLMTEDAAMAQELTNCANRHVGGITVLNKEQFEEEVKKKTAENGSGNSSKPKQWRTELSHPFRPEPSVVAGGSFARPQIPQVPIAQAPRVGPMPEPLSVPSPESLVVPKPPTAKMSKVTA